MSYIVNLGKELGTNSDIPKNIDKRYLIDLVFYSKKTLEKLGDMEEIINTNILNIENILKFGGKKYVELMEKIILQKKI